jgi:RNA polymerase sigma-70 factor, ECF subfamily
VTDARPTGHNLDAMAASATGRPHEARAFARLYADHHDGVRRTLGCLGVPAASVDDALQEVFVIVHRRFVAESETIQRAWIYGITRRVAWRHHRASTRAARRLALVDAPEDFPTPLAVLERGEAVAFVDAFLGGLDDAQREVFVLAEIEGLSAPEIASAVESNLNTVYSRLRLARARFEQALGRQRVRERREGRAWTTDKPPR